VRGALPDPLVHAGQRVPRRHPDGVVQDRLRQARPPRRRCNQRAAHAEYGITSRQPGQFEIDHLVPLELGGSNSIATLFPEAVRRHPGAPDKDRLENETHDRACSGRNRFRSMPTRIADDWTALYVELIGPLPD
jgi:hypothetical protein